jgi:hypothetical protein
VQHVDPRFTRTEMAALNRMTPWATGKSRLSMALTTGKPMPCRAKAISITTAPASRRRNCNPTTVTTGMRAFFRAWRVITARSARPLARAVRM